MGVGASKGEAERAEAERLLDPDTPCPPPEIAIASLVLRKIAKPVCPVGREVFGLDDLLGTKVHVEGMSVSVWVTAEAPSLGETVHVRFENGLDYALFSMPLRTVDGHRVPAGAFGPGAWPGGMDRRVAGRLMDAVNRGLGYYPETGDAWELAWELAPWVS
jgi:hypothetical protein